MKTIFLFLAPLLIAGASAGQRPNILWLSAEDISPHFGCYGDPHAQTPRIDQLASEGIRYTRAFTTAGVCAPCRSGIITGLYQTSQGTQHMRCTATLPETIQPFPVALREAGYFCTNSSKTDYQFKAPKTTWDNSSGKGHWRLAQGEDKEKPFFAVFNYGGCHESGIGSESKYKSVTKNLPAAHRQDPAKLTTLPPYYPDTPVVREDWKRNYELISALDAWAGDLIDQLKEDGLYENTIIFFWSDHGVGLPRAKRWLYDSGTLIPLVVRIPESLRTDSQGVPGTVTDQLVSSIDFGPTVLNLAGLTPAPHIQGQPFLGANLSAPRPYVYGARDRMDERYDIIRMVRDKRYKYIRNYEPLKSWYQYMNTPEKGATMKELRRLHKAGKLAPDAERFFGARKEVEELYDCDTDPHELHNLAANPAHAETLERLRTAHRTWVVKTKDLGLIPEAIIAEEVKKVGSEYAILRQSNDPTLSRRIATLANAASEGPSAVPALITGCADPHAAGRYWAATGLGNVGDPARKQGLSAMRKSLKDSSSAVRTAAARALCAMGEPSEALPVLIHELTHGAQWERLAAAIVLDEIDEQARPVIEQMKIGLTYQTGFNSGGKYRVRVINRALNELLGTNRAVR